MKKTTTFCLSLFCSCLATVGFGQDKPFVSKASVKNAAKLGLAFNIGTTPGIEFAYGLSPKVTLRLGYSYFKYNLNTTAKSSAEEVKLGGSLNMSLIGLSAEYFPFKKSSFKVFGGASYIDKGSVSLLVTPTGTYTFGSTILSPDEVGNVSFLVDYGKSIAPFAGIGFGRTIPKKRVGLGIEMGTYYTKTPAITLTGKERLSSMSEQQAKVQENMKDWQYWPVINFRLAVRLN
jgi:hypothetical protein